MVVEGLVLGDLLVLDGLEVIYGAVGVRAEVVLRVVELVMLLVQEPGLLDHLLSEGEGLLRLADLRLSIEVCADALLVLGGDCLERAHGWSLGFW